MDTILTEKYNNLVSTANQVISIFNHFYGEDKVDVQNYISLEEFLVRIKSINIFDLLGVRPSDFTEGTPEHAIIREAYYNENSTSTFAGNNKLWPLLEEKVKTCEISRILSMLSLPPIAILIYFPKVTITNENDESIDIFKFFCKILIDYNGAFETNGLTFNKADYTLAQFAGNYMHSHIRSISRDRLNKFQDSCLGSGPIRDSYGLLSASCDLDLWQMFCLELSQYVKTESLAGGPYQRMSGILNPTYSYRKTTRFNFSDRHIGDLGIGSSTVKQIKFLLTNFITYLGSKNVLPFYYSNNNYQIGLSYTQLTKVISDTFIEFYNAKAIENPTDYFWDLSGLVGMGILKRAIIFPNEIQTVNSEGSNNLVSDRDIQSAERQVICTFKGERIPVHIIRDTNLPTDDRHVLILDHKFVNYLFYQITVIVNINYGTRNITTNSYTGESTTNYRFKRGTKTIYLNN